MRCGYTQTWIWRSGLCTEFGYVRKDIRISIWDYQAATFYTPDQSFDVKGSVDESGD